MPHSTRRRNAQAATRTKRTNIELNDGWTMVTTSPRLQNRKDATGLVATHSASGPAKVAPGQTKTRLLERIHGLQEQWRKTECAGAIRMILERVNGDLRTVAEEEEEGEKVKGRARNAVCLGLGSLSSDNAALNVRSLWQLVAFLDIVDVSSSSTSGQPQSGHIDAYAEDPVFNRLDEEVMRELGITVLSSKPDLHEEAATGAASAKHIMPDSLVYAPFMPWFIVLPEFLKDKDPALYIGNDVANMLEEAQQRVKGGSTDDRHRTCVHVAEKFLAGCRDKAEFPDFELHDNAFKSMMFQWKKPTDDDLPEALEKLTVDS